MYIYVDGTPFDVPVIGIRRRPQFLEKSTTQTADGELHIDNIGVFYVADIQCKFPHNIPNEYHQLWDKLLETGDKRIHLFRILDSYGFKDVKGYVSDLEDDVIHAYLDGRASICGIMSFTVTSTVKERRRDRE